jgi:acyl-CoA synthetase (AMP-forming)/AMP-acid ligase II
MIFSDPVLFQCRLQPAATAMCVPGGAFPLISYGRLERFIHNIARNAQAQGIRRGDIVALFIEDKILQAAFILGLDRLGAVTFLVRDLKLPKELNVAAVISSKPYRLEGAKRQIIGGAAWTEGDGAAFATDPARSGEDLAHIILTSGTTGDAKAVAFSHALLAQRVFHYTWVFGVKASHCSRVFVDPNLSTSIGMVSWLGVLQRGGTVFFRGGEAAETFQALDLYKIQCMIGSPGALAEFVSLYEQAPGFPSNLEVIVSTGSALSKTLSERVRARLCSTLITGYGSTETTQTAVAPTHAIAHIPGAVGYVLPSARIEIVDASGKVRAPGEEGLIRISSALNASGYIGNPPGSEQAFRDGAFYPGDIGNLTPEGLLIISGREKSILNLGGEKISPERIEQVVASFPGISQAAAFSILNPLGIEEISVAVVADSVDKEALLAHCRRLLRVEFVPSHFQLVRGIPMTPMGKVDRRRLPELTKMIERKA